MNAALHLARTAILTLLLPASMAFAQSFSQPRLDQMLAPIALYPDALLGQILIASTTPRDVAEAARWSRANPGLSGELAVRAVDGQDWASSVKSLVAFPQVLAMMDERPDWVEQLGNAYREQEPEVMETVQALRQRAAAEGNLPQSEQLQVSRFGSRIVVQPVDPQVVYVPYYDPLVVYGQWWWPAYQPVRWRPWTGHFARRGVSTSLHFGPAVHVSRGHFHARPDWPRREFNAERRVPMSVERMPRMPARNPASVGVAPHARFDARVAERRPEPVARQADTRRERRDAQMPRTEFRRIPAAPAAVQAPQVRVPRADARPERRAQPESRQQAVRQSQAPGPSAAPRHEHRRHAAGG